MRLALIALAVLALPSVARAGLIFDSLALAGGPSAIAGSLQANTLTYGAKLSFSRDVRITSFALFNAFRQDGPIQFVIFGDQPRSAPLYLGETMWFAREGDSIADATFKRSGELDFTFLAGRSYALGFVSGGSAIVPFFNGEYSDAGITAPQLDPNILGFPDIATPIYRGDGDATVPVRLYDDRPAAVPEPGSMALAGVGLMGVASLMIMLPRGT